MIGGVPRHIIRIIFLILLQGLIVNRLDLASGLILPSVYIFAILMLPLQTPRLLLLVIGFVAGIFMDSFTNTIGMHTSACVFLAFAQPHVLRLLAPREGYEFGLTPTVQDLGLSWYLTYAGILTLCHHSLLFFMEVFRFTDLSFTLEKIALSSLTTVLLMVLGQYLIFTPKERSRI
jgi:hypothetical protein